MVHYDVEKIDRPNHRGREILSDRVSRSGIPRKFGRKIAQVKKGFRNERFFYRTVRECGANIPWLVSIKKTQGADDKGGIDYLMTCRFSLKKIHTTTVTEVEREVKLNIKSSYCGRNHALQRNGQSDIYYIIIPDANFGDDDQRRANIIKQIERAYDWFASKHLK